MGYINPFSVSYPFIIFPKSPRFESLVEMKEYFTTFWKKNSTLQRHTENLSLLKKVIHYENNPTAKRFLRTNTTYVNNFLKKSLN